MTLPVSPPDRTLNQAQLLVDKERRRSFHALPHPEAHRFDVKPDEPVLDSAAPVSVEAGTGAAVADLDPVAGIPLSTAISRYHEDDAVEDTRS